MKKWFSILFITGILLSNTALGQLMKLPTLFHHYNEHVTAENASFIQFLTVHYQDEIDHPDDEHQDHENLPFKNIQPISSIIVAQIPQPNSIEISGFEEHLATTISTFYIRPSMFNSHLSSIWQPPRI